MIRPPRFDSLPAHLARLGDLDFWRPYVVEVLRRHGLDEADESTLQAGYNATYPTFLCGALVVKLFGYSEAWRQCHRAERAAHRLVARNPDIAAPALLHAGRLFDDDRAPWPYLVTRRLTGLPSWRAALSEPQRLALAEAVGHQVRRIHALPPEGVATHDDWNPGDIVAAAAGSSLPSHLVAQVERFLATLAPFDRVFVHGDLTANHVFVEQGRLVGIIDWGDAMVTDRHYELIQVYRDLLGCDKALLRCFLEASDWPVGEGLPRQALGLALHRQAIGLGQHHTMDVFEPIAARFPLQDIVTLEELADVLFAL